MRQAVPNVVAVGYCSRFELVSTVKEIGGSWGFWWLVALSCSTPVFHERFAVILIAFFQAQFLLGLGVFWVFCFVLLA